MNEAPKGFDREIAAGGFEARFMPSARGLEARAAADDKGPAISGYGSVFGQPTTIEGLFSDWDEEVEAGAWTASIRRDDIRSTFNHDVNQLLGRTLAGTLELSEDDNGLFYDIDVNPDDPMAMGVHAKVARRDVDGSSVWFVVRSQRWDYPTEDNGLDRPKRTILEGQLWEVGPVTFPAFTQTTSTARSLQPLDVALRSAGVTRAGKRGDFLLRSAFGDPSVADELRHLFASAPALRDAVCACDTSGRGAGATPAEERGAETAPETRTSALSLARAQLLMRRPV